MSEVTAQVEGTQPETQQPQPQVTASVEGTQPPAAAAPTPPPTSGGMFDKVLGALAGHPQTYSVDPNTGKETAAPVTDRGSLAKHIVAAAIVGMLKGVGQRGPGSLGKAAAAGGEAGEQLAQQEDQRARQEPLENYQRQQEAATAKANALEKNLRLRSMAQTLSDADENTHKTIVANSADLLTRVKDESPSSVLAEGIPEGEAKDPAKYNILDQRIPDGVVPRLGPDGQQEKDADGVPQWEQTYTILDRHTKSSIAGAPWVQQAIEWGIPGAKGLTSLGANDQLTAVGQNHYIYQLGQLQAMQGELDSFAKKVGASPIDLKAMVNKDPSLIEAVNQFQRTSGASTQPDEQIDAMRKDAKAAPYVQRVMGMFGADNLEKFKEDRTNKMAADKAAATKEALDRVEENTPEGKQKLTNEKLAGEKDQLEIQKAQKDLNATSEWKPKVSADEKKKAELAENIGFNANEVAKILTRRKDIVGAVSGRFTNVEQMIGNNDPDIAALGTEIHNVAIASVGIHGMRSSEEVQKAEHLILNNFKNGPQAVAGALLSLTRSVQTFVDDARPEGYKTHSKSGGLLRSMQ